MLQLMRVSGQSLAPEFQDRDFVLVIKIPFFLNRIKPGDVVLFEHAVFGLMIKQVEWISSDGAEIRVIGHNPDSIDSRHFGPISRQDLIGKVVWHIRQPRIS